MSRTLAESRDWMQHGASLIAEQLLVLDEGDYSATTELSGWTRRHLVAHLSANADAIGNLVHWAATGEPTPMYASMDQRNADIEAGSQLAGTDLTAWFIRSAAQLDSAMSALSEQQWAAEVVTAQGRTVPASETPWMRSREVMVHAVDLGVGIGFADVPVGFLAALCDDIAAKRATAAGSAAAGPAVILTASDTGQIWTIDGTGTPLQLTGCLADITAYLAGRAGGGVVDLDGHPAPALPAWL